MHVHITGGGGEIGPESRCPEAKLCELIDAGVTTVCHLGNNLFALLVSDNAATGLNSTCDADASEYCMSINETEKMCLSA